jgi:hypothetical protein
MALTPGIDLQLKQKRKSKLLLVISCLFTVPLIDDSLQIGVLNKPYFIHSAQ